MRTYLEAAGFGPRAIASRQRPLAFTDLVCSGDTFRNLSMTLQQFTGGDTQLWRAVREKLRWICIVELPQPGWDGWRPDASRWTTLYAPSQIRRVAIESSFWRFLGEQQKKTTDSYTIDQWGKDNAEELDGYRFDAIRRLADRLEARRNSGASEL